MPVSSPSSCACQASEGCRYPAYFEGRAVGTADQRQVHRSARACRGVGPRRGVPGAAGDGHRGATAPTDLVEQQYLARISALPDETRRLLLLAAAEPVGDPALLGRAAETLRLGIGDLAPAEVAGLVRLGDQVTFRHPLVRSAIYRSAPAADRQSVHAALAGAIDPVRDPDHRAWHRAQAIFGPDEAAAAELERSAGRALDRGGPAAAAAFLERAAALSPDPGERARRALAAAQSKYDAGAPGAAADLLATVDDGRLSELRRAHADELAARISAAVNRAGDASCSPRVRRGRIRGFPSPCPRRPAGPDAAARREPVPPRRDHSVPHGLHAARPDRHVRPGEAGTAVSVGGALSGIGGAVLVAAITPLLVSRLIAAGPVLLHAAAGYARAWLLGAAFAAAGIIVLLLLPGTGPGAGHDEAVPALLRWS